MANKRNADEGSSRTRPLRRQRRDEEASSTPPIPSSSPSSSPPSSVEPSSTSSSSGTASSGGDAKLIRVLIKEGREARDRYSEECRKVGHLTDSLQATQAALAASEEETRAVRAQQAESDARVAALESELAAVRQAADTATLDVNARGATLAERLQDIPARTREVASHGVRRGAAVALAAVQTQLGLNLRQVHLVRPDLADETFEELAGHFEGQAATIQEAVHAGDVVNQVFQD